MKRETVNTTSRTGKLFALRRCVYHNLALTFPTSTSPFPVAVAVSLSATLHSPANFPNRSNMVLSLVAPADEACPKAARAAIPCAMIATIFSNQQSSRETAERSAKELTSIQHPTPNPIKTPNRPNPLKSLFLLSQTLIQTFP